MDRASTASGEGLQPPPVERFEELRALPVTVWIDGQHVRRVRFEGGPPARHRATLDLWEFGVPVGELDWSRLPTFCSPGYEQERKTLVSAGRATLGSCLGTGQVEQHEPSRLLMHGIRPCPLHAR